jgi:hypothetical protein
MYSNQKDQISLEEAYKKVHIEESQIEEGIDIGGVSLGTDFIQHVIPSWIAFGASTLALVLAGRYGELLKSKIDNLKLEALKKYAASHLDKDEDFKMLNIKLQEAKKNKDNKQIQEIYPKIREKISNVFSSGLRQILELPYNVETEIVNDYKNKFKEQSNKQDSNIK